MSPLARLLRRLSLLLPTLAALIWTAQPAGWVVWAALTAPVPALTPGEWQDETRLLNLRRQLQKHFLQHRTYIPLEDIVTFNSREAGNTPTSLLMQKACGRGRLFVWLPFKFKLPVFGEKVMEWCWKPQTSDV